MFVKVKVGKNLMNRNSAKKIGRRGANTWGRPGTPKLKRAASKAVRKEQINDEYDIEKSEYSRRIDVQALRVLIRTNWTC